MKYLYYLLGTLALVSMYSCSSTSPSTPPDYFKGIDKLGNYWIYQNQVIDTNGVVQPSTYTDSTWVQGLQLIDGKQATTLLSYSVQSGRPTYDTTYIYREGNKLYTYTDLGALPLDTSAPRGPKWLLVSDVNATSPWIVMDTIAMNNEIPLGTITLSIKAKFWMVATKKADTTIMVASGSSYKTSGSSIDPILNGTISAKGLPISQPVSLAGGQRKQFYADGLALVYERIEPLTINVGDGSFFPATKTPGSIRSLLRYRIQ